MKKFLSLILTIVIIFSFTGCDGYKKGKSFSYILTQTVSSLDPQTATGGSTLTVINAIFEGLCRIDENGVAPGVAKSWESNSDFTQFTFKLRDNAKWHNGKKVTAEDFIFGIQRALTPETNSSAVQDLFIIKNAENVYSGKMDFSSLGVTAINEHTLVFDLEKSCEEFPSLTAEPHYMPCNQDFFEGAAGRYGLGASYLLTNGPFTFANVYAWDPNVSIKLAQAVYYNGDHNAYPAELTFLMQYDTKIDERPIDALVNGDISIMAIEAEQIKEAKEKKCEIVELDDSVTGLLLNPKDEILKELDLREIYIKSINRDDVLSRTPEEVEEATGIMPKDTTMNGEPYRLEGEKIFQKEDLNLTKKIEKALPKLDIERIPNITIICRDDEYSRAIANGILISWNSKLNNAFNILPLDDYSYRVRIRNGDYQAALYTMKADGSSPYSVLRKFESNSSPALMENAEYDKALSAALFDVNAYRNLETMVMNENVFYPIYFEKSYYAISPLATDILVSSDLGIDFSKARRK